MRSLVLGALLCLDGIAVGLLSVFFLPVHVGSVPVPVGALVAAVGNATLVAIAVRSGARTAITALPLIGWLAVFLAATAGGPGGDAVLPGDWRSLLLLFLGGGPGLLLLGDGALKRSFARGAGGRAGM